MHKDARKAAEELDTFLVFGYIPGGWGAESLILGQQVLYGTAVMVGFGSVPEALQRRVVEMFIPVRPWWSQTPHVEAVPYGLGPQVVHVVPEFWADIQARKDFDSAGYLRGTVLSLHPGLGSRRNRERAESAELVAA